MKRRPVTVAIVAAVAAMVVDGLRVFELGFNFEPTAGALFRERVGSELTSFVAVAFVLVMLAAITHWRPPAHEAVAATLAGLALVAAGAGWGWASWRERGPAPERAAVARFRPPAGAEPLPTTLSSLSDPPSAERSWQVTMSLADACVYVAIEVKQWAPGAQVRPGRDGSCTFTRTASHQERVAASAPTFRQPNVVTITARATRH